MPELPLYGTEPRVRCKNLRGPWQEVELRVHNYAEVDRPEFWEFVDRAVAGFAKFTAKVQEKSDILQPWKQLGRTWHFARKGFSIGKKIHWEVDVLEDLMELLAEIAPQGQFLWNNKQVVPMYVPEQHEPWAAVQTKKLDAVYLHLMGPKGRFTLGQITDLGYNPELDGARPKQDVDSAEVSHHRRSGPRRPARVLEGTPGGRAGGRQVNDQSSPSNPIPLPFLGAVPIPRPFVDGRGRATGREASAGRSGGVGGAGRLGRRAGGLERGGPGVCRPRAGQAPAAVVPGRAAGRQRRAANLDRHPRRPQRSPGRPLLPAVHFPAGRRRAERLGLRRWPKCCRSTVPGNCPNPSGRDC